MTEKILKAPTRQQWATIKEKLQSEPRENFSKNEWATMWGDITYDPENPRLSDIKEVLALDDPKSVYPIGTKLPMEGVTSWNAEWIIAHYGTAQATDGRTIEGVYVVASTCWPSTSVYDQTLSTYSGVYAKSVLRNLYDATISNPVDNPYIPTETLSYFTKIKVPTYTWDEFKVKDIDQLFFAPSCTELAGGERRSGEGVAWEFFDGDGEYAKAANRLKITTAAGAQTIYWSRTSDTANSRYIMCPEPQSTIRAGSMVAIAPQRANGVCVAGFIAKD